jgi:predicted nucleic acid-binding protein
MKHIVVDASVAVQWIVKQEHTKAIDSLFLAGYSGKSSLHVPALWLWECSNALLTYCKAGWLTPADMDEHLSVLRYPKPNIDGLPTVGLQKNILELAYTKKLSFYDASYLELAQRHNATLATLDKKLRVAALASGVPCIDFKKTP